MIYTGRLLLASLTFLVLCLASAAPARADTVTLTFDELPTQPVNGLSFRGVTFGFTQGNAFYNASFGPVGTQTVNLRCPCLAGDAAGTLTLTFAQPTSLLQFGLARSTGSALSPGATVRLFDPASNLVGTIPVPTAPLRTFSEALFTAPPGLLVSRAVITFDNPTAVTGFALDNLTFDSPAAANVPEPATLVLLGTGLAAVAARARKRRKAAGGA